MTHTPPEADLSPEPLADEARRLSAALDRRADFFHRSVYLGGMSVSDELDIEEKELRPAARILLELAALADPPPADGAGLEETRARWERMAIELVDGITFDQHGDRVILDPVDARATIYDALNIAFDAGSRANAEHARAEGLAKEVERLEAAVDYAVSMFNAMSSGGLWENAHARQASQALGNIKPEIVAHVVEREAKLAVYEAPVGDGERDAILARLDERHRGDGTAATRFTLEGDSAALLRRLSAINAKREGEKADLLGHMRRIRDAAFSGTLTPGLCADIVTEALASRAALSAGEAGT